LARVSCDGTLIEELYLRNRCAHLGLSNSDVVLSDTSVNIHVIPKLVAPAVAPTLAVTRLTSLLSTVLLPSTSPRSIPTGTLALASVRPYLSVTLASVTTIF